MGFVQAGISQGITFIGLNGPFNFTILQLYKTKTCKTGYCKGVLTIDSKVGSTSGAAERVGDGTRVDTSIRP